MGGDRVAPKIYSEPFVCTTFYDGIPVAILTDFRHAPISGIDGPSVPRLHLPSNSFWGTDYDRYCPDVVRRLSIHH